MLNFVSNKQKFSPTKHILFLVLLLVACLLPATLPKQAVSTVRAQNGLKDTYVEGEIVLGLTPGTDINTIATQYHLTLKESLPGADQYLLALAPASSVESKIAEFEGDLRVLVVGPNFKFQPAELRQRTQAYIDQRTQAYIDNASPVNFFGQPMIKRLHIEQAQSISRGAGVRVAVIDTGLDLGHPLFAGRIAYPNYDFVDNDGGPDEIMGGAGSGHGTFVAGLVALTAPDATIMPLRAFAPDGSGTTFNIAKAIRFATDNGANVINMSFGLLDRDPLIEDALNYAYKRVFMISAAGNDNLNLLHFPSERKSKTLSVVSTDDNDRKAVWSNFNRNAQVAAPGVDLYSAYPGNRWATWSGTSFSTALVSGEAALVLSLNPSLGRTATASVLTSAGPNINALNPRYSGMLGNVRIDFLAAVQNALAR